MLYDLIKSHAALFFMQRRAEDERGRDALRVRERGGFCSGKRCLHAPERNGGRAGIEDDEERVGPARRYPEGQAGLEFTIQDLQRLTGWSYSSIYRTLKGYDSRGKNYTGLLEKCPALSFTDRTVTVTEKRGIRSAAGPRRSQWDRELYRQWNGGGACWLDRDPKDGDGGARLLHCCMFPAHLLQLLQMKMAFPVPPFPAMVLIMIIILY